MSIVDDLLEESVVGDGVFLNLLEKRFQVVWEGLSVLVRMLKLKNILQP